MSINLKSLIQKLNPSCRQSLEAAAGACLSASHYNVEIEHWLLKLLDATQNDLSRILPHYGVNIDRLVQDLSDPLSRLKTGNTQAPALSQRLIEWIREALIIAQVEYGTSEIRSGFLLYALLNESGLNRLFTRLSSEFDKIPPSALQKALPSLIKESSENPQDASATTSPAAQTSALLQYTLDLTQLARDGKIDPVIGREAEIRQVIDILTRRRQNNPILVGEPGVGKTAVVEGFALSVARGEVPPMLKHAAVHTLDLGLLQAGAGIKGEFENRLKSVIEAVKRAAHPIILFIDEAHTLVGAGAQTGQGDAANLLKPVLARGELRTIAATTWAEYKKYFEQDAALTRRFQVVKVDEPDERVAIHMLRGLVSPLETHHQVRVLDEAITAAVRLSARYLNQRQLPDKAISVLDTACARLAVRESAEAPLIQDERHRLADLSREIERLQRENLSGKVHEIQLKGLIQAREKTQARLATLEKRWEKEKKFVAEIRELRQKLENLPDETARLSWQTKLKKSLAQLKKYQGEHPLLQDCVDAQSVAEVIHAWTGVPLGHMRSDEIQGVLQLEGALQARIMGQHHALKTIAQRIQTSRAQLTDPRKPIAVFLLVGPSGVGKTETALALAELLYGGVQNMTIINLSEFKEEHKVSLLLGSPPGYVGYGEGGVLTEAVRRRPYSLVLLDEVEKAHVGVQDVFYQVFDKGMLRDGEGRDVNFKNTVIILTANSADNLISKFCAEGGGVPDMDQLQAAIRPELLKTFKPAFLGRVTVVPYLPLSDTLMRQIISLQLGYIRERVFDHYQAKLTFDPSVFEHIQARCQEVQSGARTIDHLLSNSLLPQLSTHFLARLGAGEKVGAVEVGVKEGQFVVECAGL